MSTGTTLTDLARGVSNGGWANAPFWWDAAPPDAGPWPALPAAADVVVVGAGFTGLSAALVLARAGRHVVVVDAGVPGFGASTRNGGQVGSGNQKFRVATLIAMRGERHAVELLHEGVEMLDGIEALIREEGIDCDFMRCGRFRGAMRPEHYDPMARDMEDLKRYAGVTFEMIPAREQHREVGTDRFYGGSLLPRDASVHPGKYHAGLMARAIAAGATVQGNARVLDITADGNGHIIRFEGGAIRARDVLVATNGYTSGVGAYFDRRLVPIASAQIATGEIPAALLDTLLPNRRVYGNTHRVLFYYRTVPGQNRIIWGGRVERMSTGGAGAFAHLARDLLTTFPALRDVKVTHGWTGLIANTFDQFPHLGRTDKGLHYAIGYCGTGVSRSTHFGRKIAFKMLGDPRGRSAFDEFVFPSHRFHMFARPAVPVVETWYRIRDAAGI